MERFIKNEKIRKNYMKTIMPLLIILILIIGCSPKSPTETNIQPSEKTTTITIKEFKFNPNALTISAGTTVKWVNEDVAPHTIKSEFFNSATLKTSDSFEFAFENKGSYDYICGIHPSMKGKIIVE